MLSTSAWSADRFGGGLTFPNNGGNEGNCYPDQVPGEWGEWAMLANGRDDGRVGDPVPNGPPSTNKRLKTYQDASKGQPKSSIDEVLVLLEMGPGLNV